jgi:hypothetical protein
MLTEPVAGSSITNSPLLLAAVNAGLPVNLTNPQGSEFFRSSHRMCSWARTCAAANTLLMLAAYSAQVLLAQDLLSRGADPKMLNELG